MNQQQIHNRIRELDQLVEAAPRAELARQSGERKAIHSHCESVGHVLQQHPIYRGCQRCVVCGWDDCGNGVQTL